MTPENEPYLWVACVFAHQPCPWRKLDITKAFLYKLHLHKAPTDVMNILTCLNPKISVGITQSLNCIFYTTRSPAQINRLKPIIEPSQNLVELLL